jgi:hypothetical protein
MLLLCNTGVITGHIPHWPFNDRSNDSSVHTVPKLQAAKIKELSDSWYKQRMFLLSETHPVSCPVDTGTLTGLHFYFQGFVTVRLKVKRQFRVTVSGWFNSENKSYKKLPFI